MIVVGNRNWDALLVHIQEQSGHLLLLFLTCCFSRSSWIASLAQFIEFSFVKELINRD